MLPDIILDRDGVINHDSPEYIKSPEEWIPIDGSIEGIVALKCAGYRVFVATNQSGIGRGMYTEQILHEMHFKMATMLEQQESGCSLDGIYFCPHLPKEECHCRKPLPGMLLQIAKDHQVSLGTAYYVGDSLKDLQAAQAAGAQGVLVLTGNGMKTQQLIQSSSSKGTQVGKSTSPVGVVPVFGSLSDFCDSLLRGTLLQDALLQGSLQGDSKQKGKYS